MFAYPPSNLGCPRPFPPLSQFMPHYLSPHSFLDPPPPPPFGLPNLRPLPSPPVIINFLFDVFVLPSLYAFLKALALSHPPKSIPSLQLSLPTFFFFFLVTLDSPCPVFPFNSGLPSRYIFFLNVVPLGNRSLIDQLRSPITPSFVYKRHVCYSSLSR